jgi:hypothetical protein
MHLVGLGRTFLTGVTVWAALVGCGSTSARNGSDGAAGGDAGRGGALESGGTSGADKGGATSRGGASSSSAGKASGGSSAATPEVLTEADPDEPCVVDPLATRWTESAVELKGGSNLVFKLGAGGPLAMLVGFGKDALIARTNREEAGWTDAVPLPDSLGTDFPERIEISPDGSTALVLWRRGQQLFFNLLNPDGSFAPAVEVEAPQGVTPLALSGQRALFGYASDQGVQLLEYTQTGGLAPAAPIATNYRDMYRDAGETVAVFATSGLVAEPDKLYPYKFGSGFGEPQAITAHAMPPSISQTFFFAFPNGRAARLTRTWEDPATRGLHLTTRQAGTWGAEELVSHFEGQVGTWPTLGYTQDRLLLAWKDDDKQVEVMREHDGKSWQAPQVLPRSRGLEQPKLVSAEASAVLLGEQALEAEQVSVQKLYRRGSDGTWYCPKLVPNVLSQLASDGQGFWFAQRMGAKLSVWRFKPDP